MKYAVILALALAACTSDDTSGDDTGGMCSASQDTCSGDTICISGQCVAAFPRSYTITNLRHSVSAANPTDGTSWDVSNGLPDLFVVMSVNGTMSAKTPTTQDSLTAAWLGPFTVRLTAGATLTLQSFDEDISSNDPGYTCAAAPVETATLRLRSIGCQTSAWSMTFEINPVL